MALVLISIGFAFVISSSADTSAPQLNYTTDPSVSSKNAAVLALKPVIPIRPAPPQNNSTQKIIPLCLTTAPPPKLSNDANTLSTRTPKEKANEKPRPSFKQRFKKTVFRLWKTFLQKIANVIKAPAIFRTPKATTTATLVNAERGKPTSESASPVQTPKATTPSVSVEKITIKSMPESPSLVQTPKATTTSLSVEESAKQNMLTQQKTQNLTPAVKLPVAAVPVANFTETGTKIPVANPTQLPSKAMPQVYIGSGYLVPVSPDGHLSIVITTSTVSDSVQPTQIYAKDCTGKQKARRHWFRSPFKVYVPALVPATKKSPKLSLSSESSPASPATKSKNIAPELALEPIKTDIDKPHLLPTSTVKPFLNDTLNNRLPDLVMTDKEAPVQQKTGKQQPLKSVAVKKAPPQGRKTILSAAKAVVPVPQNETFSENPLTADTQTHSSESEQTDVPISFYRLKWPTSQVFQKQRPSRWMDMMEEFPDRPYARQLPSNQVYIIKKPSIRQPENSFVRPVFPSADSSNYGWRRRTYTRPLYSEPYYADKVPFTTRFRVWRPKNSRVRHIYLLKPHNAPSPRRIEAPTYLDEANAGMETRFTSDGLHSRLRFTKFGIDNYPGIIAKGIENPEVWDPLQNNPWMQKMLSESTRAL